MGYSMTRALNCPLCGSRLKPSNRTRDHFIPKWMKGGSSAENRWPMCKACNTKKGNRLPNMVETLAYNRWLKCQS